MSSSKDFQEKVDVLDIIISILKDHEDSLSKIAERFDALCSDISTFREKASVLDRVLDRLGGQKIGNIIEAVGTKGPLVTVNCKSWQAFKGASQGALLVAYEVIEEQAFFSSVSDLFVFTFSGGLSETSLSVSKGERRWIERSLRPDVDETLESEENVSADGDAAYKTIVNSKTIKRWLSAETGVPEDKIVEGKIIS